MARRALTAAMLTAVTLTTADLALGAEILRDPTPRPVPASYETALAEQLRAGELEVVDGEPTDDDADRVPASMRARSGPDLADITEGLEPLLPEGGEDEESLLSRAGSLLFSSGFEDGLDGWGQHNGSGISIVDDPVREGDKAVRLSADDSNASGGSVRTQLDGPVLFHEGDEAYIGWASFFPSDTPAVPPGAWFVFFEFHGRPHNGSPLPGAFCLSTQDGEQVIDLARSAQYGYDRPWRMPMVTDRWVDFVLRVKFSKDAGTGFIELWVDGEPQTFGNGSTRLQQSTIMSDQNDGLYPIATNYRKAGAIPGPVTVYHDAVRVADTYGAARPAAG